MTIEFKSVPTLSREPPASYEPREWRLACVCGDARRFTWQDFTCKCGRTRKVVRDEHGPHSIEGDGIRSISGR